MSIQWPVDNPRVTGEFGNSPDYYAQFGQAGHNGIDLGVSLGTPVYATDDGTVVAEGWGNYDNWMGAIAGIFVRVGHTWGYSAYAHLSSSIVNVGQWVNRGQLIGYSGATGVGTGPHLHFETFPNYPNFGNGFAGRINPHVFGIVPRGNSTPAKPNPPKPASPAKPVRRQEEDEDMARPFTMAKEARAGGKNVYEVTTTFPDTGDERVFTQARNEEGRSYIKNVALAYGCSPDVPYVIITASHYDKVKGENAETRKRVAARK